MRRTFVLLVVLAVGFCHMLGAWRSLGPVPVATALERLHAGTADQDDRRRCLAAVRDAAATEPHDRLRAAVAALLLEDRAAWDRSVAAAGPERALLLGTGPPWPAQAEEARALSAEASFGEHWLRHLLYGHWLRARGDPAAGAELTAAQLGARLCGAVLGGELAAAAAAGGR